LTTREKQTGLSAGRPTATDTSSACSAERKICHEPKESLEFQKDRQTYSSQRYLGLDLEATLSLKWRGRLHQNGYMQRAIHSVCNCSIIVSRDSSVRIETGYWSDSWGSIPGRGKRFFTFPQRPDRLWDPPSLLTNGHRGDVFPGGKAAGALS
jgi:hypothetical protein